MTEEHYILLLQKQLAGDISPAEQAELDAWLAESADHRQVADAVRRAWELSGGFAEDVPLDLDADFANIEKKLAAGGGASPKIVPMRRRRIWLAAAAAVAVLLVAVPFLLKKFSQPTENLQTYATADQPSEQVILPDGTRVWLNKHTEFSYYTEAAPKVRRVKLKGEAYFDVRENPESPFVVETTAGEVTVLGTVFSVKNVEGDNDFIVHVTEGKVQMAPAGHDEKLILTEDESGIFQKKEKQLRKEINLDKNDLAWHTGRLNFKGTPLPEALVTIGQLYDAEIRLENEALRDCTLNASFHMRGIESVQGILEAMLGAEMVETETGKYALRGGRCQ